MNITVNEFLTQIVNTYLSGRGGMSGFDILVSQQLFDEYEAGLVCLTREVPEGYPIPTERMLVFKHARLYVNPEAYSVWQVLFRERD